MSIELMKRALDFITNVSPGEHEGSRADREKLEADLTAAIQQAEAQQPVVATACGIPGMAKTTCPYCEQGFTFEHEQAATPEPAVSRNPFASRCYTMSESHLSGHRLIVGFEKLGDAQDAHEWVTRQGRGDFTHPAPSEPVAWMASYVDPVGNDHVYVTSHHDLAVENDMHGTPRPLVFGDTHPAQSVFLVRDIASLLGASVPVVCNALAELGYEPRRSTNAAISPDEALAVASRLHPAPSVPKDDQIAALVNKVRDIARMFHDHQSLRERIAIELVPALKVSQEVKSDAERGRLLIKWLKRYGLLQAEFGQIGAGEKPENWWLLHAPWGIDQTRPFLGHGKTPEQAIDAALQPSNA